MKDKFFKLPEFYFVSYSFLFLFIKPLYRINTGSSTILLLFLILLVLLCFFLFCDIKTSYRFLRCFVFLSCFLMIFIVNYILCKNDIMRQYFENFVLYAVIPLIFILNVNNYRKVLNYFCAFSCVAGIMLCIEPFVGYAFTSDYMQFGFNMLFYSFIGLILLIFSLHKKVFIIPLIAELLLIFLYGNKGAFITAIVLLLFFLIFVSKHKLLKFFVFILSIVCIIFWKEILLELINIGRYLGIDSYSLDTFKILISDNYEVVTNSRIDIWKQAWEWIKDYPIFGSGIGTFEVAEHGYAHNIFIDITVTFGIVGLVIFFVFLLKSLFVIKRCENAFQKQFILALLLFWIVAMEVSLTFWSTIGFWIYLEICFLSQDSKMRRRVKNEKICFSYYCSQN